jgi:hypothetical protein
MPALGIVPLFKCGESVAGVRLECIGTPLNTE